MMTAGIAGVSAWTAEPMAAKIRSAERAATLGLGRNTGIRHCDPTPVPRSSADVARVLNDVERVRAVVGNAEHGTSRWQEPLPVPSWESETCRAIAKELSS